MRIWINGTPHDLDGTAVVADALSAAGFPERESRSRWTGRSSRGRAGQGPGSRTARGSRC